MAGLLYVSNPTEVASQDGPCKHLMALSTDQSYDNLQMALTCRLISESYDAISSILG
jgi:hypothetical protein